MAVVQIYPAEVLLAESLEFAQGLAGLGANRRVMGSMKGRTKGHVARGILGPGRLGAVKRPQRFPI